MAPWAEPTGIVSLSSGTSRFRDSWAQNLSTREFLRFRGSRAFKGGKHPRVVLGRPKHVHMPDLKIQY